jgi:hypothetical protein
MWYRAQVQIRKKKGNPKYPILLSIYQFVIYFLGLVIRGRIRIDLDSRVRIRNPSFSGKKNKECFSITIHTVQQESGTLAGTLLSGPGNLVAQSV